MPLIDDVKKICDRLAPLGWRDLLLAVTGGGLDISQTTPAKLRQALTQDLAVIDRFLPGFEDFNPAGKRGITAGQPAQSLFFHALASPHVTRGANGVLLGAFPSASEIETIENFVFAVQPRSLQSLRPAGNGALSIVVFAYEYRPAVDSADNAYADLVFSRTGIARVGTARPHYDSETRGFWPEDENNAHSFRVIPVRFSAWLAAPVPGKSARVMRLRPPDTGENKREFLVPIHKLFDGPECLSGVDLTLDFAASFFNLKLQKVRLSLGDRNPPSTYPFVITEGLAELTQHSEWGRATVVPILQKRLIEPAIIDGKPLTYVVPPKKREAFATYTTKAGRLADGTEVHPFPAYVHARTKVENGSFSSLNDAPDVNAARAVGKYEALLYIDFTGEGWVQVDVPKLKNQAGISGKPKPAYVLLSAPDFFPACGQRELSQWNASQKIPGAFREQLWGAPPLPLSEMRFPANLQLPNTPFAREEDTITAVIGIGKAEGTATILPRLPDVLRSSTLPDDAAGVFAPGWDVSIDVLKTNTRSVPHLAAYGLGSPFPEDAKLCAALSTFWPAVAPDVYRTMSPHTGTAELRGTVAPLTDEEIGQTGALPWDGITGPRVIEMNGQTFVEMASFIHADYVTQTLENRFSLRLTARISSEEYERRVLVAARVHYVLSGRMNVETERTKWLFLSFRVVTPGDTELQQAQNSGGLVLAGPVYRVEVCQVRGADPTIDSPRGVRWRLLPKEKHNFFFVSPTDARALRRRESDVAWAGVPAE